MREIKFRGKRIDNGEWVHGAYFCLHHNDERQHIHHFIIPDNTQIPKEKPIGEIQVEVDPATVGQYTGLKDKNGVEICEGDILKIKEIQFDVTLMGRCRIVNIAVEIEDGLVCFALNQGIYNLDTAEVIGNVRENPDLLEGGTSNAD